MKLWQRVWEIPKLGDLFITARGWTHAKMTDMPLLRVSLHGGPYDMSADVERGGGNVGWRLRVAETPTCR